MAAARIPPPATKPTTGTRAVATEAAPYAVTHRVLRGGRWSGHQTRALPSRAAGDPAQRWPAGTRPNTAEPGAISAPLPMRVPGSSVERVPTVDPAPMRTAPTRTVSPSIQYPERSTSGSTDAPRPMRSMPVTGGSVCRSTSSAMRAPSARA